MRRLLVSKFIALLPLGAMLASNFRLRQDISVLRLLVSGKILSYYSRSLNVVIFLMPIIDLTMPAIEILLGSCEHYSIPYGSTITLERRPGNVDT